MGGTAKKKDKFPASGDLCSDSGEMYLFFYTVLSCQIIMLKANNIFDSLKKKSAAPEIIIIIKLIFLSAHYFPAIKARVYILYTS